MFTYFMRVVIKVTAVVRILNLYLLKKPATQKYIFECPKLSNEMSQMKIPGVPITKKG